MSATGVRLRLVETDELTDALRDALAGGPPVAPLSPDPVERRRALTVLQPERPVTEPDAAAVLITSGTSGTPKPVVLSRAAVRTSVEATHARLGGPGDWLLALPTHFVAGFMMHARTVLAGTPLRPVRTDLADLPAPDTAERRYLSLVPTQLARASKEPVVWAALSDLDAVLLGGGAADDALVARALADGICLVTTYGMTETCGGVVYDGRPLDTVTVELDAEHRIILSGPMLFSGYRLQPELTAETVAGGRLRTADRGRWHEGRLQILGRADDVIISGGLAVDLAEVERLSRVWAGADREVVAIGVPDPAWGTAVVAVTDGPGELADLQQLVRRTLPHYAAPRALVVLPTLPRLPSGKPDRQAIRAKIIADRIAS